ncbi:uncharacterized protein [Macrobrachium rosenbergii]|uniref:uncharacterized protein n=1 Tax=Macrobrachium rosenbergii TaxID=79674 RepID=UPI0034D62E7E
MDQHGRSALEFCVSSESVQLTEEPRHISGSRLDLIVTDAPAIVSPSKDVNDYKKKTFAWHSASDEDVDDPDPVPSTSKDDAHGSSIASSGNGTKGNIKSSSAKKSKATKKRSFALNSSPEEDLDDPEHVPSTSKDHDIHETSTATSGGIAIDSDESGTAPDKIVEDPNTPPRKKAKDCNIKIYSQRWRDSWMSEPQFSGWLAKSNRSTSSKDLAFCSICNLDITCGKSEIARHAASQKHKRFSLEISKTKSMSTFVSSAEPIQRSARRIELMVCAFLSEHHLAISLCKPFMDLLHAVFLGDIPLKKVKLGKQRASNIIRQVFGKVFARDLYEVLRQCLFSVIIDETTDRSSTKQLCIIVQYFMDGKLQTSFFYLIEVYDSSAAGLFNVLKESFTSKDIPLENIAGCCSDTTNVMMGARHSVASLLKSVLPKVVIVKCACHMVHLAASYACLKLPRYIEDLCRNIFSHFNLSSKRQYALNEFQKFVEIQPHKILAPGQTRWLSLQACVKRLLEQWDALILYFRELAFSDPTQVNDMIVDALGNEVTVAYLEFLDYNLGKFNQFNTLFQSKSPNFFSVKSETCKLIRSLCSDFMNVRYVKTADISLLNPSHPTFSSACISDENIYIGLSATHTIDKLKESGNMTNEKLAVFYKNCRSFLVEAVSQIQTRFSLEDSVYKVVSCLNPCAAVSLDPPSLGFLFDEIPQLSKFADKKMEILSGESIIWTRNYLLN